MARPTIEPITAQRLPEFAAFLSQHLDPRRSPEAFAQGLAPAWPGQDSAPNHGFALWDDGRMVGGIGAIYATRNVAGQRLQTCNITGWCVLDSHRQQSMRLAMAVVGQKGYHFTDFSPTKVVASTLQFLKFKPLDDRRVAAPNLPLWRPGGPRLLHRADDIRAALSGDALQVYEDHAAMPWLNHLLLGRPGRWCHVVYKRRSFKSLPAADLLFASDPDVLREGWHALGAHLLLRGFATRHVDLRILGSAPWPSALRSGFNPKVYLSDVLTDRTTDCLYSESVTLDL